MGLLSARVSWHSPTSLDKNYTQTLSLNLTKTLCTDGGGKKRSKQKHDFSVALHLPPSLIQLSVYIFNYSCNVQDRWQLHVPSATDCIDEVIIEVKPKILICAMIKHVVSTLMRDPFQTCVLSVVEIDMFSFTYLSALLISTAQSILRPLPRRVWTINC